MRYITAALTGISLFSLAAVSTASAADMMPRKAPIAPVVDPWTGSYVGASVGAALLHSSSEYTPQGVLDPINDNFLSALDTGSSNNFGIIGGLQFGFNQRSGNMVWGLEADFSGLSTKTSRDSSGISPSANPFTANHTATLDMLATARGRFGMLINPTTLAYVTGGIAMADVQAHGGETGAATVPPFTSSGSISQWTPGWTVGAGAEWKVGGPWSVKAEYMYVNLNAVRYNTHNPESVIGSGFENIGNSIAEKTQLHIVRVGLNYKFGGGDGHDAYAAVGPVAYNWSGAYAGLNLGGVWGNSRAREPDTEACPGCGPWLAFGDTFTAKTSGGIGGAQLGYNWQMNSFVYGVEGDLGYLRFKGSQGSSLYALTTVNSTGGIYGTFRGRLGYAFDRTLLYATGGLIVADVGANVSDTTGPAGDGFIITDRTKAQAGWVLGGGIEYAMMHGWSLKGEYMHFDLGTKRVSGNCYNCTTQPAIYAWDIKNTGDFVRIGINRKFF